MSIEDDARAEAEKRWPMDPTRKSSLAGTTGAVRDEVTR